MSSEKMRDFKAHLPSSADHTRFDQSARRRRVKTLLFGLCLVVLGAGTFVLRTAVPTLVALRPSVEAMNGLCPQAKPIKPIKHSAIWDTLVDRSASEEYREHAIDLLSEAVKIRYVFRSV